MRFGDLPRAARLYVALMCGLAVLQASLLAWHATAQAPLERFALLLLATAVAHSFPVSTPGKQAYHVSLPFFVAGMVLLSPVQFAALVGLVHLADWLRRPRSRFAQAFNASVFIISGLAGQAVFTTQFTPLSPATLSIDLSQPACLVAGLAAAATFGLLNRVLVSIAIWLGNRISPLEQHMFEPEGLVTDAVLLIMGVPLAQLALIAPWAAALGSAPLWLIHRVLDLPNARAQRRQDGLTELFTAPYLTETCTREINRAHRFDRPTVLLLLDLDGLGELNAAHGQPAGDAVLRETARTIQHATREYDLPARLAGGLFAVLLPETDLAQAQVVAERVRRDTAARRHEIPGSVEQARLTVSIGGAVLNGGLAAATAVFEAARSALAQAKRDGGNQIEFLAVDGEPHAPQTAPAEPRLLRPVEAVGKPRAMALPPAPPMRVLIVLLTAVATLIAGATALPASSWPLLVGLTSVAVLAGLGFYFKGLAVAVPLALELHRSPARLRAAQYWRIWPQYLALGATGFLLAYAYLRFGPAGAMATVAAALVFRNLAGRYVDHTLESVRKLRTANEQLEHRAFHDPLTGLANRALFAERLEHAMLRANEDRSVAVLFVDLDNFKLVNDTLGHAAGDTLLVAATERLLHCVRREDSIARLGGDEFTVLLEDMRDPSDAARLAERIGEALRTPFQLAGQQVTISSSIGIALDTDRSHRPDDLLREADMAMYRAKSGGKACYEIFDTTTGTRAMQRLELETELRHAAQHGQLVLKYEPIVDLTSGRAEAVEAVLRWQHPRRGLLEAAEFLNVAEESGIIVELGRWAVRQACDDAARDDSSTVVQVQLSTRELEQPGLLDAISASLAATGLPPEQLRLAISESAMATDGEATAATLDALQNLGVRLALTEVGGGLSSLAWLSCAPVETLVLAASTLESASLMRTYRALGATLGMKLAARTADRVRTRRHGVLVA